MQSNLAFQFPTKKVPHSVTVVGYRVLDRLRFERIPWFLLGAIHRHEDKSTINYYIPSGPNRTSDIDYVPGVKLRAARGPVPRVEKVLFH